MASFKRFFSERWRSRPHYLAFYLVSPTLLFADYRKYCLGTNKTAVAVLVKMLNIRFLTATTLFVFVLLLVELSTGGNVVSWPSRLLIGVVALYSFSRCNEIFIAFVQDATSHLRPHEAATGLKYYERIGLAMRSYLELILAYATIYYAMPRFGATFADNLTLLDAIYFSGVTITTIGYGDIRPTHWAPKLMTVFEVLNGISLIVVSFTVYVSRSIDSHEVASEAASLDLRGARSSELGVQAGPPGVSPPEVVGRYFESQYRRLGQLEEHGLHASAFIATLTVAALTFGYRAETPEVLRNAALPVVIVATNLAAALYVWRGLRGQEVHSRRAKESLRLHAPALFDIERRVIHGFLPRWRLRPGIQIVIHLILVGLAAYLWWSPPQFAEKTGANMTVERTR